MKLWYHKNKKAKKAQVLAWRKANPLKIKEYRKSARRKKKDNLHFVFYRDFLKPLTKLPSDQIEDLLNCFKTIPMPLFQFKILELAQDGTFSQVKIARMLGISQTAISLSLNKILLTILRDTITNYKTSNKDILDLIMKVVIN